MNVTVMSLSMFVCGVAQNVQPPVQAYENLWYLSPGQRSAQRDFEMALLNAPSAAGLQATHILLCRAPHIAGTADDEHVIQTLLGESRMLESMDVQRHVIEPLLAYPVRGAVQIVAAPDDSDDALPIDLPVQESPLFADKYTDHPELTIGFNAWSGSGEATGEVVYVNYGTKEDFEALAQRGVSLDGRIALARYGGNYRGFKAHYAEQAGAVGLLIYTDPVDSGFAKGEVYPDGGWANESYIQRGSVLTLPWKGDPLTPFVEARPGAPRLDESDLDLPTIPVQPIGYGAASEMLSRMRGAALPDDLRDSWQGGLPMDYRLTGGPSLRVRVQVEQTRERRRTANVIATLPGAVHPEQVVVIGCHHDAWSFGAGDPQAGTIVVHEIARAFDAAAQQGWRPARTIVFAHWAAEEYGIFGSTEWVEAYRDLLDAGAIAYLNFDMAAMGVDFRSSAAPLLKSVIEDATMIVPQAQRGSDVSVFDTWRDRHERPNFGDLGGGSDHVGFYGHVGIPSAGFSAGGSDGVSYHSNYETLTWYRQIVGREYEPAIMLARVGAIVAARLANAEVLPLDARRYAPDLARHLDTLESIADQRGVVIETAPLRMAIDRLDTDARALHEAIATGLAGETLDEQTIGGINAVLLRLERAWTDPDRVLDALLHDHPMQERRALHDLMTGRMPPGDSIALMHLLVSRGDVVRWLWSRSLYAASDPTSGYAAWMLPALRRAIEDRQADEVRHVVGVYADLMHELARKLNTLRETIEAASPRPVGGG